ncbi:MAG: hypothetical protein HKP58_13880 [Desulfatitalea sp.]|nr:pyridoxamine 5'-phosphate oxidase family protein [Desulfatitalea sp.]NNK01492.1 hypothetical protein [Desulfatitalea sp.]
MVLATNAPNGCWTAPVYYVFARAGFYFFSSPEARHIQHNAADDRAAASIYYDNGHWEDIQGLQMSGHIHPVRQKTEKLDAMARFLLRFPFAAPFLEAGKSKGTSLPKLGNRVGLYCFVPLTAFYTNNRLGFGKRIAVRVSR